MRVTHPTSAPQGRTPTRRLARRRAGRLPIAALALAVAILAASCATPEPRSIAPPPSDGLFVLAEIAYEGAGDGASERPRAYFVEVTSDTVRLEPVGWDSAAGSWRETSAETLYLARTTPREAESARVLVKLMDDAIEVVNKQERVRAVYVSPGSPGAPEVPSPAGETSAP